MNEIATSTDKLPAAPTGPKRITHKVRRAIDIMVAGDAKTITEAAEKAGLSREHNRHKAPTSADPRTCFDPAHSWLRFFGVTNGPGLPARPLTAIRLAVDTSEGKWQ